MFYSCIQSITCSPLCTKLNLRFCCKIKKERKSGKREQKCRRKTGGKIIKKCWKRARFLIRRRYNIYSVSPGMRLLLSLLSSHSSMLMLNFQNFYITKGPTTSAGEKPRQVHNPSQGAARCSGERNTRAHFAPTPTLKGHDFRQFFRRIFLVFSLSFLSFLSFSTEFNSGGESEDNPGSVFFFFGRKRENVSHLSGTGSRCGGIFILLFLIHWFN